MSAPTFTFVSAIVSATHVEIIGNLSGVAAGGAYNVPGRFIFPTGASPVVNAVVCEPLNDVMSELYGFPSGDEQAPPFIYDAIPFWLGDSVLTEQMGMCGFSFEMNKDAIDQFVASGAMMPILPLNPQNQIPFDPTWTIAVATDGYEIMADASLAARDPATYFFDPGIVPVGGPIPAIPGSDTSYLFGFSQMGAMVRGFVKDLYNTSLAGPFPAGLVYDGALAVGNGAVKRVIDNAKIAFVDYVTDGGATGVGEGQFAELATETDIFFSETNAAKAPPSANYNTYELAGSTHLNGIVFSLENRWYQQLGQGLGPVMRGLIEALRQKVVNAVAMPPDAVADGVFAARATPWVTVGPRGTPYPFGRTTDCWIPTIGDDGNILGGIRLPHLRTRPSAGPYAGACVGAPLGINRGLVLLTQNLASQTRPDAPVNAPAPPSIYRNFAVLMMYEGFNGYYEPSLVAQLYPESDACKYAALIAAGADYALSERWILPFDRDAYVAFAVGLNQQDLINLVRDREVGPQAI